MQKTNLDASEKSFFYKLLVKSTFAFILASMTFALASDISAASEATITKPVAYYDPKVDANSYVLKVEAKIPGAGLAAVGTKIFVSTVQSYKATITPKTAGTWSAEIKDLKGKIIVSGKPFKIYSAKKDQGKFEMHIATIKYTPGPDEPASESPFDVKVKLYFVHIKIAQPSGDPSKPKEANEFNERVFDTNIHNPDLTIPCIAEESGVENHLMWEMGPGFISSEKEWKPAYKGNKKIGTKEKATLTLKGLPDRNSSFGLKKIHLKTDLEGFFGEQDTTPVELFFPRDGANHPDGGDPSKSRNWFYYWNGTAIADFSDFKYNDSTTSYGCYSPSEDQLYLGRPAPTENSGPWYVKNKYTNRVVYLSGTGEGIDCCAEVISHEREHKRINTLEGTDTDEDGIPDVIEAASSYGFNPYDADSYFLARYISFDYYSYGDAEFLARKAEEKPAKTYPKKDWSNMNGKNWDHE